MTEAQKQQLQDLEAMLPDLERRVQEDIFHGRDSGAFLLFTLTQFALDAGKRIAELEQVQRESEGD